MNRPHNSWQKLNGLPIRSRPAENEEDPNASPQDPPLYPFTIPFRPSPQEPHPDQIDLLGHATHAEMLRQLPFRPRQVLDVYELDPAVADALQQWDGFGSQTYILEPQDVVESVESRSISPMNASSISASESAPSPRQADWLATWTETDDQDVRDAIFDAVRDELGSDIDYVPSEMSDADMPDEPSDASSTHEQNDQHPEVSAPPPTNDQTDSPDLWFLTDAEFGSALQELQPMTIDSILADDFSLPSPALESTRGNFDTDTFDVVPQTSIQNLSSTPPSNSHPTLERLDEETRASLIQHLSLAPNERLSVTAIQRIARYDPTSGYWRLLPARSTPHPALQPTSVRLRPILPQDLVDPPVIDLTQDDTTQESPNYDQDNVSQMNNRRVYDCCQYPPHYRKRKARTVSFITDLTQDETTPEPESTNASAPVTESTQDEATQEPQSTGIDTIAIDLTQGDTPEETSISQQDKTHDEAPEHTSTLEQDDISQSDNDRGFYGCVYPEAYRTRLYGTQPTSGSRSTLLNFPHLYPTYGFSYMSGSGAQRRRPLTLAWHPYEPRQRRACSSSRRRRPRGRGSRSPSPSATTSLDSSPKASQNLPLCNFCNPDQGEPRVGEQCPGPWDRIALARLPSCNECSAELLQHEAKDESWTTVLRCMKYVCNEHRTKLLSRQRTREPCWMCPGCFLRAPTHSSLPDFSLNHHEHGDVPSKLDSSSNDSSSNDSSSNDSSSSSNSSNSDGDDAAMEIDSQPSSSTISSPNSEEVLDGWSPGHILASLSTQNPSSPSSSPASSDPGGPGLVSSGSNASASTPASTPLSYTNWDDIMPTNVGPVSMDMDSDMTDSSSDDGSEDSFDSTNHHPYPWEELNVEMCHVRRDGAGAEEDEGISDAGDDAEDEMSDD